MTDNSSHIEFPFQNYDEFINACRDGILQVVANTEVIQQWFDCRWHIKPPLMVLIQHIILKYAHLVLNLQVIAYGILNAQTITFAVVPLTFFVKIALSPAAANPNRLLRLLIMTVLIYFLCWAVLARDHVRSIIMGVLVLSWLAQKYEFELAARSFFSELFKNERFCQAAWLNDSFVLRPTDNKNANELSQMLSSATVEGSPVVEIMGTLDENSRPQFVIQGVSVSAFTAKPYKQNIEVDAQSMRKIDVRAMDIVFRYEKNLGREPKDVSMYYTGYDIQSSESGRFDFRAIEVKGKSKEGVVLISSNEWKTAAALGEQYYLYIVEDVFSKSPRIKIIQDPAQKLRPSVHRLQYIISRNTYISKAETSISVQR